ncbi:MAG: response regulator [Armatimonadetes bacterium]|nr:response regulator [Armatimonadota bacterium]
MSDLALPNVVQILLVEDDPADAELTLRLFRDAKVANQVSLVEDGEQALAFLRREVGHEEAARPDLIILDLNLPVLHGTEVLRAIKDDPDLRRIPVVVLTTSQADEDIVRAYNLRANCFLTKPLSLRGFVTMMESIDHFWLSVVRLPHEDG